MYDTASYLQLASAEQHERRQQAARVNRAARLVRLRRLDRRVEQVAARARLLRLALD